MGLPDVENIPDTGAVFTIGRSRFAENVASHFFIRKDPVVSVTCGDEHSAVVCQSGRLFVFGSNDWGQLGLGHKNHVSKPSCVKVLKPEKVTHVACGRAHTLICTAEQKIYACGSDQESQLGRGSQTIGDSSSSPVMVHDCGISGPKIIQIAAGSHHSLALTSDGCVLAWGSNLEGQLGLPGTSGLVNKPTKVHMPEAVKQISAGYYHSAFLTENGSVYVCGEAESGKLGIPLDFRTQVAPKQMQLSGPVASVACGGHHTIVLDVDGNIYCTGSNASGQLGMGTSVTEIATPKILSSDALQGETVKQIACGESHIAVVTESGKLLTCGDGRHGKLGLEENENNVHELTLAAKYQELVVSEVSCGGCHTILVGRRRLEENDEIANGNQINNNSSLPPLKVPVTRIPVDENLVLEKPEQVQTNADAVANGENAIVKIEEKETSGTAEEEANTVEKPESPKKMSDYEENLPAKLENGQSNDNDELPENNNAEETDETEEKPEVKNNETEMIDEEKSSDSRVASAAAIEVPEKLSNANGNLETMEETKSPPPLTPPPKPPRQKIPSADNSRSSRHGSSTSLRMADNGNMESSEKKEDDHTDATDHAISSITESTDGDELVQEQKAKSDNGSAKKSASSEKSRSAQSKSGTDETAVADGPNILDEIEGNGMIEESTKNIADDADVLQPSPPRTGKISKLFKTKKQEAENGTKAASTVNTKAKSKTCTIL